MPMSHADADADADAEANANANELKDICLLIPTLSPNGKQNDLTREKSKRNRSNVITHEPKSKKNAPSKTKRVKSVLA